MSTHELACYSTNSDVKMEKDLFGVSAPSHSLPKFSLDKKAYHRAYRKLNGDKIRAYQNKWNRLAGNYQKKLAYRKANPRLRKKWQLKNKYKISLKQWDELFESQDRKCAICRTDKFIGKGPLTDHNHATGSVRGILCQHCNTLIGNAKESVEILREAIHYLTTHSGCDIKSP